MKGLYVRIIEGIFILLVALGPVALFAFPIVPARPFGGKVLLSPIPGAICPTSMQPTSPFNIIPVSPLGKAGPFSEVPGPQTVGKVVMGQWILGLYWTIPIPDCEIDGAPATVYKAYIFGTNVPDLPI